MSDTRRSVNLKKRVTIKESARSWFMSFLRDRLWPEVRSVPEYLALRVCAGVFLLGALWLAVYDAAKKAWRPLRR